MVINTEVLKQKINLYCNKEIEKEDLGLWAMEAYYALMRGEYIDIEKLKIYHFLRTISTFHMRPNDITGEYPCTENDVLEIKKYCPEKERLIILLILEYIKISINARSINTNLTILLD